MNQNRSCTKCPLITALQESIRLKKLILETAKKKDYGRLFEQKQYNLN